MNLVLAAAELVTLTGYKRARDQAAWIREHYGIRAVVNAMNECVVIRAHIEAAREPGQDARPRVRIVRKAA